MLTTMTSGAVLFAFNKIFGPITLDPKHTNFTINFQAFYYFKFTYYFFSYIKL